MRSMVYCLICFAIIIVGCKKDGSKIILSDYRNKIKDCFDYDIILDSVTNKFKDSVHVGSLYLNEMEVYLLKQIKEPILSDHYLNKEVYRVIIQESFKGATVVRFEKEGKKTSVTIKKLNKEISYPFIVYGDSFYTEDENHADTAYLDSLKTLYNKEDYFVEFNDRIIIKLDQWDYLNLVVDSTDFWDSEVNLITGQPENDGSLWIIEGHIENGYQIKRIFNPFSPYFDFPPVPEKEKNSKYKYSKLFRQILKISGLNEKNNYKNYEE